MPHPTLGGLRPVFDFRQQRRFDPDSPVRDPLGVGLRLPDQRFETGLQVLCRGAVGAMVDLAGVDQLPALAAAFFLDGEAGDCQGLPLRAGLLDPIVAPAEL
jgi:hypothetical protein